MAKSNETAFDWAKAFEQIAQEAKETPPPEQSTAPVTPVPASPEKHQTPAPATGEAPAEPPRSRYEELCRTPSMKIEKGDLSVITEFSRIIAQVQELNRVVDKMKADFPDALPERFYNTWSDNMKETTTVMLKEFHAMRHGRMQKKYDKRYVCSHCQSVFMMPLPSDGICDACRGAMTPRGGAY